MKTVLALFILLTLTACNGSGGGGGGSSAGPAPVSSKKTGYAALANHTFYGTNHLVIKFPDEPSRDFNIQNFAGTNVATWDKYLAYVKVNGLGKHEVHVMNMETQVETQLAAVNSAMTNYVPVISGFAHGLLVINSKVAGMSSQKGIYTMDVRSGFGNWVYMNYPTFTQDGTASVSVNRHGFHGTIQGSTEKMMFYIKLMEDGSWSYRTKCPGYDCTRPFTFVGVDDNNMYYIGTDDATNTTLALRTSAAGEMVADNLHQGYNSVIGMVSDYKFSNRNFFLTYTGTLYGIGTINDATTDIESTLFHNTISNIMTDGKDVIYQANSGAATSALFVGGIAQETVNVTKVGVLDGKIFYMKSGNTIEMMIDNGSKRQINLHTHKGVTNSGFGPIIDGKMYFDNYINATDTRIAVYDFATDTTTNESEDFDQVQWVMKLEY